MGLFRLLFKKAGNTTSSACFTIESLQSTGLCGGHVSLSIPFFIIVCILFIRLLFQYIRHNYVAVVIRENQTPITHKHKSNRFLFCVLYYYVSKFYMLRIVYFAVASKRTGIYTLKLTKSSIYLECEKDTDVEP